MAVVCSVGAPRPQLEHRPCTATHPILDHKHLQNQLQEPHPHPHRSELLFSVFQLLRRFWYIIMDEPSSPTSPSGINVDYVINFDFHSAKGAL